MIAPIWIFNKYFPLVDFFFSVFPHLKVLPLLYSLPHILASISFYCLAHFIFLKVFSSITSFLTFAQIYSHLNTFVFISLRIVVSHMREKHIEYLFSWVWVTSFSTTFSVSWVLQIFIFLYGGINFHCIHTSQSHYSLICWWTSRLIPFLSYYEKSFMPVSLGRV